MPGRARGALGPPAAGRGRTWDQLSRRRRHEHERHGLRPRVRGRGRRPGRAGTRGRGTLGAAIEAVARDLARQQAADGEGATTLITPRDRRRDDAEARAVARAVVSSSLVKAAAHGRDPNWGRDRRGGRQRRAWPMRRCSRPAGCAPPRPRPARGTPGRLDPDRLRISIAGHLVFDGAQAGPVAFDRAAARAAMDAPEVVIELDLGLGSGHRRGLRLRPDRAYVIENSEYTT